MRNFITETLESAQGLWRDNIIDDGDYYEHLRKLADHAKKKRDELMEKTAKAEDDMELVEIALKMFAGYNNAHCRNTPADEGIAQVIKYGC